VRSGRSRSAPGSEIVVTALKFVGHPLSDRRSHRCGLSWRTRRVSLVPHKGLELISILILQRLEDRVCRIAVELDIELRPNIIGQLVQLTPCRNGHQNCSRTFLDREFSQPGGLG
jgi:hypothetical protein